MTRRGLTLLEVLAAAALLAVIASACLPMLAEGTRWKATQRDPAWFDELATLADRVVAHPESYGLSIESLSTPGFTTVLQDSAAPSNESEDVVVRVLEPGVPKREHPAPDHTWIEFIAGEYRLLRFIDTRHMHSGNPSR